MMPVDADPVLVAVGPVFVIAALAMPAGVGGGLLHVPVLLSLGVVDSARAGTALSQPLVVAAACAANLFDLAAQCRDPSNALIEPALVLAAVPMCLAGTILGALLNQVLPETLVTGLLLVVIGVAFTKTLRKGLTIWKKESAEKAARGAATMELPKQPPAALSSSHQFAEEAVSLDDIVVTPSLPTAMSGSEQPSEETDLEQLPVATPARPERREEPCWRKPAAVWCELLLVWLVVLAALLLRGGKGAKSFVGIAACSTEYWAVTAATLVALAVPGLLIRRPEVAPAQCLFTGTLSAIVGIGGGMVLNPMLLSRGVSPLKTMATVSVMMLMVSSAATAAFVLAGTVPVQPAAILGAAAFFGSLVGKAVVGWLVEKTGRVSIIVLMLAVFMAFSAVLVGVQGAEKLLTRKGQSYAELLVIGHPCA